MSGHSALFGFAHPLLYHISEELHGKIYLFEITAASLGNIQGGVRKMHHFENTNIVKN